MYNISWTIPLPRWPFWFIFKLSNLVYVYNMSWTIPQPPLPHSPRLSPFLSEQSSPQTGSASCERNILKISQRMGEYFECTAPTWKGDLNFSKWEPKGDLILSEMGTKRGPSAAEKGTKRGLNGDLKSVYLINWPKRANSLKKIFVYKKSSPSVLSFSAQLGWGISINKLVCNQGFNAVVLAIRLPFTGRTLPVNGVDII